MSNKLVKNKPQSNLQNNGGILIDENESTAANNVFVDLDSSEGNLFQSETEDVETELIKKNDQKCLIPGSTQIEMVSFSNNSLEMPNNNILKSQVNTNLPDSLVGSGFQSFNLTKSISQQKIFNMFSTRKLVKQQNLRRPISVKKDLVAFTSKENRHRFLSEGRKLENIHSKRMIDEIKKFKEIIKQRYSKATLKDYEFPRILDSSMISCESLDGEEDQTPKIINKLRYASSKDDKNETSRVASSMPLTYRQYESQMENHFTNLANSQNHLSEQQQDEPPLSDFKANQKTKIQNQDLTRSISIKKTGIDQKLLLSAEKQKVSNQPLNKRIMTNIIKNKSTKKLLFKSPLQFEEYQTKDLPNTKQEEVKINFDYYQSIENISALQKSPQTSPKNMNQKSKLKHSQNCYSHILLSQSAPYSPKITTSHLGASQQLSATKDLKEKSKLLNQVLLNNQQLLHNASQTLLNSKFNQSLADHISNQASASSSIHQIPNQINAQQQNQQQSKLQNHKTNNNISNISRQSNVQKLASDRSIKTNTQNYGQNKSSKVNNMSGKKLTQIEGIMHQQQQQLMFKGCSTLSHKQIKNSTIGSTKQKQKDKNEQSRSKSGARNQSTGKDQSLYKKSFSTIQLQRMNSQTSGIKASTLNSQPRQKVNTININSLQNSQYLAYSHPNSSQTQKTKLNNKKSNSSRSQQKVDFQNTQSKKRNYGPQVHYLRVDLSLNMLQNNSLIHNNLMLPKSGGSNINIAITAGSNNSVIQDNQSLNRQSIMSERKINKASTNQNFNTLRAKTEQL